MKKIHNSVLFLCLGFALVVLLSFTNKHAENKMAGGIKFSTFSISKAMAQAKKSNKLIFIDVHTSWCGPCKEMAHTTFQDNAVAKKFNSKFINLKIDAEKSSDGPALSKKYSVSAYPTLLWINSEGKLVKKVVGKQSSEKLLSIADGL